MRPTFSVSAGCFSANPPPPRQLFGGKAEWPVSVESVTYPPWTALASAVQVIVPAYPPPPTPWNRLVHAPGSGSQISILICGSTTIETSQNAGRPRMGGDAWGFCGVATKPAGSGRWNVPPGKDLAVIEVTS